MADLDDDVVGEFGDAELAVPNAAQHVPREVARCAQAAFEKGNITQQMFDCVLQQGADVRDTGFLRNRSYGTDVVAFAMDLLENSGYKSVITVYNGSKDLDSASAVAIGAICPLAIVKRGDGEGGKQGIVTYNLSAESARFTPRAVKASMRKLSKSRQDIVPKHVKTGIEFQKEVLDFSEGTGDVKLLQDALVSAIQSKVVEATIDTLLRANDTFVVSSIRSRQERSHERRQLHDTPVGSLQAGGNTAKAYLDAIAAVVRDKATGIMVGKRKIADNILVVVFPPAAKQLVAWTKKGPANTSYTGAAGEDIQYLGGDGFSMAGLRFAVHTAARPGCGSLAIKTAYATFVASPAVSVGTPLGDPSLTGDVHRRSLAGDVSKMDTLTGPSLYASANVFQTGSPAANLLKICDSSPAAFQAMDAKVGIRNITTDDGTPAYDIMASAGLDDVTGQPTSNAADYFGSIMPCYTSKQFMTYGGIAAWKRVMQDIDQSDVNALNALGRVLHQAASGHKPRSNDLQSYIGVAFAIRISTGTIVGGNAVPPTPSAMGVLSVPQADDAGNFGYAKLEDNELAVSDRAQDGYTGMTIPKGRPFPGFSTPGHVMELADISSSGVLPANLKTWSDLWGGDHMEKLLKIYEDGFNAIKRSHSVISDVLGSDSYSDSPVFSGSGVRMRIPGIDNAEYLKSLSAFITTVFGSYIPVFAEAANANPFEESDVDTALVDLMTELEIGDADGSIKRALKQAAKVASDENMRLPTLDSILISAEGFKKTYAEETNAQNAIIWLAKLPEAPTAVNLLKVAAILSSLGTAVDETSIDDAVQLALVEAATKPNQYVMRVVNPGDGTITYRNSTLAFTSECFVVRGDIAATDELTIRPMSPASTTAVYYARTADVAMTAAQKDDILAYGSSLLAERLPLHTSRAASRMTAAERAWSWHTYGALMASGYDQAVRSIAFNQNVAAITNGRPLDVMPPLQFAARLAWLSTKMSGPATAHVCSMGVPVPVRAVAAWMSVVVQGESMIMAPENVGAARMTDLRYAVADEVSTESVEVLCSTDLAIGLHAATTVAVASMAVVEKVNSGTNNKLRTNFDRYTGRDMVVCLVGQTSQTPSTLNMGGPDVDVPTRPSFDSCLTMGSITHMRNKYAAHIKAESGGITETSWTSFKNNMNASHDGFNVRQESEYVQTMPGVFKMTAPGTSALRLIGVGVNLKCIRALNTDPSLIIV